MADLMNEVEIEVLLFDFDGTLMDTEWAIYSTWRDTYEEYGQELRLETYVQCIGSDFDTWSPKTHLEELTGREFDWSEMDPIREGEFRRRLAHQGAMPGAREVLESLRGEFRMAVVSASSHSWVDGWLASLGLNSFFEVTVCRGDAPKTKPEPDLYLQAAQDMGVSPEQCLVIEDSLNGTKAGKAAGMEVYAIPNRVTQVSDFSEADETFQTLTAFRDAMRRRCLPER